MLTDYNHIGDIVMKDHNTIVQYLNIICRSIDRFRAKHVCEPDRRAMQYETIGEDRIDSHMCEMNYHFIPRVKSRCLNVFS